MNNQALNLLNGVILVPDMGVLIYRQLANLVGNPRFSVYQSQSSPGSVLVFSLNTGEWIPTDSIVDPAQVRMIGEALLTEPEVKQAILNIISLDLDQRVTEKQILEKRLTESEGVINSLRATQAKLRGWAKDEKPQEAAQVNARFRPKCPYVTGT